MALAAGLVVCAAAIAAPRVASAVSQPGLRYQIDVSMDTERNRLDGWATIHYRSGADTALPALYLHTYPNAFSGPHTVYADEAVRVGEDYDLRFAKAADRGWMTLDSAAVGRTPARVTVMETLARVDLPHPLAPGDSVTLRVHFTDQIPKQFDRFGHTGDAYSISQWYPKLVVYDDLGWHLDPFHFLSEFYGEYATYDVTITLPDRYWVGATGLLQSAHGGDNEIPPFLSRATHDSVTVAVHVVSATSLSAMPLERLKLETDLFRRPEGEPLDIAFTREGRASLRVPKGVPVHYTYQWKPGGKEEALEEIDSEGHNGPLHLLVANRDTTVIDTLRALSKEAAPGDTVLPSLKTLHYHAERVHDFALVACPDYVRADTTWSGIRIRALVFRDDEPRWHEVLAFTVDAMRHHSKLVGPYVWPSFTSAEAYCGGGAMEYPMLVMNEPDQYSRLFHNLDDTNAHELGHNWFYGMLGSDERANPWLDEGFTEYIQHDYTDSKYRHGLFRYVRRFPWVGRFTSLDSDEQTYLARAWARDEQPMATPADGYLGYPAYGVGAYGKPVSMLHTLRGILGDSVFVEFLHEYYRRNLLRHPRPEDVYRAASDAAGEDLKWFFHPWVESLQRPGFAMGRVHRQHAGGAWRSVVTVRKTEAMSLPVPVEARFADGTHQEKIAVVNGPEGAAVFESSARLTQARLDPRHEIVEMNRLDNATGVFPPMRFRFLAGFPSSEAIGADYGPTIWHGTAEGLRLGSWLDGRYLPSRDFPYGIRGFEAGMAVGTHDGSVSYRAGAWRRWGLLGARSRVRGLVARDEGLFRMGLEAGNVAMAPSRRHPFRTWTASLAYRDREDLAPVDSRYWSLGRTLEGSVALGLETIGPRRGENMELTYRHGASAFREEGDPSPDANYDRIGLTVSQQWDLPIGGGMDLDWRGTAGSGFRRVPRQVQFDIAQAGRLDALPLFYANDRGPLRETDHFVVPGGGGLRGYAQEAILGQRILAANLEIARSSDPWFLFADVGRVEASGVGEDPGVPLHPLVGRTLADAGAAVRYGPVEIAFPAWVGSPPPDENPWDFRWQFSIGEVHLPRP